MDEAAVGRPPGGGLDRHGDEFRRTGTAPQHVDALREVAGLVGKARKIAVDAHAVDWLGLRGIGASLSSSEHLLPLLAMSTEAGPTERSGIGHVVGPSNRRAGSARLGGWSGLVDLSSDI